MHDIILKRKKHCIIWELVNSSNNVNENIMLPHTIKFDAICLSLWSCISTI